MLPRRAGFLRPSFDCIIDEFEPAVFILSQNEVATAMPVEQHLLYTVLAFEDELIDLQQLTSACRTWASDKTKPLADLLVERGWVSDEDRAFLDRKSERKLAKHQNDPQVTLNMVTRGDIGNVLRNEVDDTSVQQSLNAWPSKAPVLVATLIDSGQPQTRYTSSSSG